jgi:tetratricopeptide (TPR) repeat protein
MKARRKSIGVLLTLLAVGGSAGAAQEHAHAGHDQQEASSVPLHADLGNHHLPITTSSPEAQPYFDQGLRLQYAFNHAEAIRSYQEALRHDPDCAMCWWGVALASGHNINAPMTEESGRRAFQASREALQRAGTATPVERHLIEALAQRYGPDPAKDRVALDSAYARAMEQVAETHGGDPDVLTLLGAALMNLSPWNYWEGGYEDRKPLPGTERIAQTLSRALSVDPNNPGACHYYIHLMEAAFPEKAVECADRLAALMPGAGHIVHMPGHIYIRVGRYADAVRANEHAVHSDESFMVDMGAIPSLYTGAYYPHNYHFMAFAATMAGMSDKALEASRVVAPKVPAEVAREVYWIQNAVVLPHLTLLTFGHWEEVLAETMPPEELQQASILAQYARGAALAALGRSGEAREILTEIQTRAAAINGGPAINPIPHIAPHVLAGEIALRSGDPEGAVRHFQSAADLEDSLLYDEPPLWYYPVRHSLGHAYLEAGQPAEAEEAYREDLYRFPENGWSLFGLATSLEAQGKTTEAEEVWARYRSAWAEADVELQASRF